MVDAVLDAPAVTPPATPPADTVGSPTDTVPPITAVPETYDLKLPAGSTVDPAIVERTAATARALGLTNDAGQKLLDSEVATAVERDKALTAATTKAATDATTALLDAWEPETGAEWKKRKAEWIAAGKADPEIGGAKYDQSMEKGMQALNRFASPKFKEIIKANGYDVEPEFTRFLAKIGSAMSESTMATLGIPTETRPKSTVNKLYGNSTPEPE